MTLEEFLIYSGMLGSLLFFGGGAILALSWAIKDGQFENFDRGAKSIFAPDEPIGEPTDWFPDNNK